MMKTTINNTIKKTGAVCFLLTTLTIRLHAQTNTNNYVITKTARISGLLNDSTLNAASSTNTKVQTSIQYVDGLGRSIQTVNKQASQLGYDVIIPMAYDKYGREVFKYMPYTPQTGTVGSYRTGAVTADSNFYKSPPSNSGVTTVSDAFAQSVLDNSPLNRTVEQGSPGAPWQITGISGGGQTTRTVYTVNNSVLFSADSINGNKAAMYYTTINADTSETLHANGYYSANTLTVTVLKDENTLAGRAGTTEEYKDLDGHVVLKRVYNYVNGAVQQISTYFVYDDMGRLAYVLPPNSGADGAITLSQTVLDNLCYQYRYDGLGRIIAKKVPGKGWEEMVYNQMDGVIYSRDALQKYYLRWNFVKYDILGRVIITGYETNNSYTRAGLQNIVNAGITGGTPQWETPSTGSGNVQGYTNNCYPKSTNVIPLIVKYYDSYIVALNLPSTYAAPSAANLATRGELTASKIAILNSPTNMLWAVSYFDNWGRSIQSYKQHYLAGVLSTNNYDVISTTYNFNGVQTTTTRKHWNTASTSHPVVTVFNKYTYDQIGRKKNTWQQITNGASAADTIRLISSIDYNEIGQMWKKHFASKDSISYLQAVNYTYNERGWLLTSNANLFSMQLYYNTGTTKRYNGDITYQYWGTPGNLNNHYSYAYDKLDRLARGASVDVNNENSITYDQEGNLTGLRRYQTGTLIDQLSYTYLNGSNYTNQVQKVIDTNASNFGMVSGSTTYVYDVNGNLSGCTNITNATQNKNFTFNILNLPTSVTTPLTTSTFTYDAAGNKLRKVSVTGGVTTNTDYIQGIQYGGSTGSESIYFIQTAEGRAAVHGSSYDYQYNLEDNLGNSRVTFSTINGVANILQSDDYYPFGLEISRTAPYPKNEYLYNSKELQEEFGEYDYGARFYDPIIARWTTIDPLADKYYDFTPYTYAVNNPISVIDPDGRDIYDDSDGGVTFNNDNSPDASNALSLLQGKKSSVYVDIEGSLDIRKQERQYDKDGGYGKWAVFTAKSISIALDALTGLVSNRSLNDLVLETHGSQNGESAIQMSDNGSLSSSNFIYNSNVGKVVGTEDSHNTANCPEIEKKVAQLKELSDLVKNNGNFVMAACFVGKGEGGESFARNINLLTGNRLNIYLPMGFVTEAIGRDAKNGSFIPFLVGSFIVDTDPGWIKISPSGKITPQPQIIMNIDPNAKKTLDFDPPKKNGHQ